MGSEAGRREQVGGRHASALMPPIDLLDLFDEAVDDLPDVVYLTGKTCTGKSTLALQLSNRCDYDVLPLDDIVVSSVIEPLNLSDRGAVFVEVYRNRERMDWMTMFVTATRDAMARNLERGRRVVMEGAVANPATLGDLIAGWSAASIVYLHPVNRERYARNITRRFVTVTRTFNANLPPAFWAFVDSAAFERFCSTRELTDSLRCSIDRYAGSSMRESTTRLYDLRRHFPEVLVIEI